MESSIREYINELKKNIVYWEKYRDGVCPLIIDSELRNIMVDTSNEIIQNRQEELEE